MNINSSVCNNKQRWNEDKCRYECKELIDKGVCDKGSIWNPSNCECECDKSCDVGQYLDYENCRSSKKKLINWLKNVLKILMKQKLLEWLYLSIKMSVYVLTQFVLSWL